MLRERVKPDLKYIGQVISIKSLINAIHEFGLSEDDTILLHSINFDDIVLEYRNTYHESISIPYILVSVLIEEDINNRVPQNRIGILRNDFDAYRG